MTGAITSRHVCHILGVPIDAISMSEVLTRIDDAIIHRRRLCLGVVNAAKIVNMRRDPRLQKAVLSSDLIVADGMSIVWAARMLNRPLPERVTGIDLMLGMLRQGNARRYRVYCLGATAEVLDKTIAHIAAEYPDVVVVGRQHGYFAEKDEPAIAARIAGAQPDVLFVAMTSPKKEEFLARWAESISVPVCHGVGGSFEILAGSIRRAPERWQRLGLEWLFRVCQEPRRLWRRYLVTNTLFCAFVIKELLTQAGPGRRAAS